VSRKMNKHIELINTLTLSTYLQESPMGGYRSGCQERANNVLGSFRSGI
jgi:hypothetical protein